MPISKELREETAKINSALTACNGDREAAAAMLNVPFAELKIKMMNRKALRVQWSTPQASKEVVVQSNGQLPVPIPAETQEEMAARAQADFEKLMQGANGDVDLAQALSLQKAYGKYTEQCQALVGGSLIEQAMKLKDLLNKIHPRLTEGVSGALPEGFTSMSILYTECQKQLGSIMEKVNASLVVNAKVKAIREAGKNGKARKPGFGPKNQTNVVAQNFQLVTPRQ